MSSRSSDEGTYLPRKYDSTSYKHKRSASSSSGSSVSSEHKHNSRRSDLEYHGSRHHQSSRRRSRSHSSSQTGMGSSPARREYTRRSSRDRQRSNQGRDRPQASRCIGVFGLNTFTTQQKVRELFNKFGPIERIQMVIDAHTHRSRGFCFIYFENLSDARVAKDACSGMEVDDRRIRVDYSITQRAHTPTPGVYMGRPSRGYAGRSRSPRSVRRRERSNTPNDYHRNRNNYRPDRNYRSYRKSPSRHRYMRSRSHSRSRTPRKSHNSSRY